MLRPVFREDEVGDGRVLEMEGDMVESEDEEAWMRPWG